MRAHPLDMTWMDRGSTACTECTYTLCLARAREQVRGREAEVAMLREQLLALEADLSTARHTAKDGALQLQAQVLADGLCIWHGPFAYGSMYGVVGAATSHPTHSRGMLLTEMFSEEASASIAWNARETLRSKLVP